MRRLLLLSAMVATALALGACSSSDSGSSTTSSLTFTDGDSIAELTNIPSFFPANVSPGSDVAVRVAVDSDTTNVIVRLGVHETNIFSTLITSAITSVSPSATTDIAVTVTSDSTAAVYAARIDTCSEVACSTGRIYAPFSSYQIFDLSDGSFLSSTSVTPLTFTVESSVTPLTITVESSMAH